MLRMCVSVIISKLLLQFDANDDGPPMEAAISNFSEIKRSIWVLMVHITCDVINVVGGREIDVIVKVGIVGIGQVGTSSAAHLSQRHGTDSDAGASCGRKSAVQILVVQVVKPFVGRFPHDGANP